MLLTFWSVEEWKARECTIRKPPFHIMCAGLALFWVLINLRWTWRPYRTPEELYSIGGFDSYVIFQITVWISFGSYLVWWCAQNRHFVTHSLTRPGLRFLAAYGILSLLSSVWSVSPSLTAFRALQWLLLIALVLRYHSFFESEKLLLDLILWCGLWTASIALTYSLATGAYGGRMGEELLGTNATIPVTCGSAALIGLARGLRTVGCPKIKWFALTVLMVVIVIAERGRTGIMAMYVGITVVLFYSRHHGVLLLSVLALALVLLSPLGNSLMYLFNRRDLGFEGPALALTGRLDIWRAIPEMLSFPELLLGKGYVAGSRDWFAEQYLSGGGGYLAHSAHNALLQGILETGLLGAAIIACCYCDFMVLSFRRVKHTLRHINAKESTENIAIVLLLVVIGVTTTGIASCIRLESIVPIVIALCLRIRVRRPTVLR